MDVPNVVDSANLRVKVLNCKSISLPFKVKHAKRDSRHSITECVYSKKRSVTYIDSIIRMIPLLTVYFGLYNKNNYLIINNSTYS